jgi:hypothetical protein
MRTKTMTTTYLAPYFLILSSIASSACGNGIKAVEGDSSATPGPDADSDTDADSDADTDSDADSDADSGPDTGDDVQADLTGRTYDIDLAGADITWRSPVSGPTLITMLQTDHLLLMVESSGPQIDTVAAAAMVLDRGLTQYPCALAIDFAATPFSANPKFVAGPLDASLAAGSTSVPVYGLIFGGTFSADGSKIEQVEVSGLIDARPISSSQGIDVCAALPAFGDECVACSDGEVACIALDVLDSTAPYQADFTVNTAIDPANDSHCD